MTIAYPIFVKPVKAAFSVLAKRCADEAAREHLRFRLWEKIIIKRLTWPFRRVSRKHLDCEIDADASSPKAASTMPAGLRRRPTPDASTSWAPSIR